MREFLARSAGRARKLAPKRSPRTNVKAATWRAKLEPTSQGKQITKRIEELGVTRMEVAVAANIDRHTLRALERGKHVRRSHPNTVNAIVAALDRIEKQQREETEHEKQVLADAKRALEDAEAVLADAASARDKALHAYHNLLDAFVRRHGQEPEQAE